MKTILITGAAGGIGSEIARVFARENYAIVLGYNSSEAAALALLDELRGNGAAAIAVRADISSPAEAAAMVALAYEQFGGVDVLINNAGVALQKMLCDTTEVDWDRLFDINVKGAFLCAKEVLPTMLKKHSGRIVNISSIWGISGASCEVAYSASKAALIGFTKALAKEVAPSGITVNCIAPGVIDTAMNTALSADDIAALREETPLGRIGTAADIAEAALFLTRSGFITGEVLNVNGGLLI